MLRSWAARGLHLQGGQPTQIREGLLFRRAHHFKCWKPLQAWPLNLEDFITVVLDYKKIVRNLRKKFCHFGVERWLKAAPMPLKLGTVYTHGLANVGT